MFAFHDCYFTDCSKAPSAEKVSWDHIYQMELDYDSSDVNEKYSPRCQKSIYPE